MEKKYLNDLELAKITGRSRKSWQRDRVVGGGIPYIKCGGKVLYDLEDITQWLNSRKVSSTSEYPAGA